MAKRNKNQARRSGRAMPGWAWLATGLLVGGLAFGYLQFGDQWRKPVSLLPTPNPKAQAPSPSEDNAVPDALEKPKPKYDFYTLLPEKEVVIPDAELDAQARAEAAKPPIATVAASDAPPTGPGGGGTASSTRTEPVAGGTTPASVASDGPRYLIQAGAFRGTTEAEALKAQIALTGEIARVEVAQINGNTVHRVRMGPYPNASALAAAKQALASHGITAQAIKVK